MSYSYLTIVNYVNIMVNFYDAFSVLKNDSLSRAVRK